MPTEEVLRQAEILAMRQLSDNLGRLNTTVEKLDTRMDEVRSAVIRLEAQELKASIGALRTDLLEAIHEVRQDHDKRIDELEKTVSAQGAMIAGLRGRIVPFAAVLSALAAGLLAFLSELVANLLTNGGAHH